MSYQRDRDSATRGAGAIASRDLAHPAKTRARQRARAVATLRRDRALRGATMGTGGGVIGGLGAISRANIAGGLRSPNANRMYGGGQGVEGGSGITTPPIPPRGGGGGSPPKNDLKNRTTHAAQLATLVNRGKPTKPTRPVKPGRGGQPMHPGTDRPPPSPTPTPTDTSTSGGSSSSGGASTSGGSSGGSSGGGGGGGGGVSTSPGSGSTGLPDYTPVDLPDADDAGASSTATPAATSSGKMLLIAAGIGLAALLLLSDDKDTD